MMMNRFIRDDLRDFVSYDANQVDCRVKLDANESHYDIPDIVKDEILKTLKDKWRYNLYPDSDSTLLRTVIAESIGVGKDNIGIGQNKTGIRKDNILVGNGSDQLIQIIINCIVGVDDRVVCPAPSFGMYKISAAIAGAQTVEVPLDSEFQYDLDKYMDALDKYKPKVAFICTPNNPTGCALSKDQVISVAQAFPDTAIVVDEAYCEFNGVTVVDKVEEYDNLIVLRTLSKAYGLAGLRVGYSIACEDLTRQLHKVKPPYNLNTFSQQAAVAILKNKAIIKEGINTIVAERDRVFAVLKNMEGIKPYPSSANFILIKCDNGKEVYQKLLEDGILVRSFGSKGMLDNCIRVSIGTPAQNDLFLSSLKAITGGNK
ncbi:MAG: histidinol-phosphate transaminase [Mahellales bacterium]|jgi:histidinol-phosphate aminotransferase